MEEVLYRPPLFTPVGGNISVGKQASLFEALLNALLPDPCGEGEKEFLQEEICRPPSIFRLQDVDRPICVAQVERNLICGAEVPAEMLLLAEGVGGAAKTEAGGKNLPPQVVLIPAEASLFRPEANLAPARLDLYVDGLSSPQKWPPVALKMDSFSPDLPGGAAKQLEPSDGSAALPLSPEQADPGAKPVELLSPVAYASIQDVEGREPPLLKLPPADMSWPKADQTGAALAADSQGSAAAGEFRPGSTIQYDSSAPWTVGRVFSGQDPQTDTSRPHEVYLYSLPGAEPSCGAHRPEPAATADPGADQDDGQKRIFQPVDIYPGEQLPPKRASVADAAQPSPILPSSTQRPPESLPAGFEPGKGGALKEQLLQQIQGRLLYIRENGGAPAEMRLRLNPPEMGEITIRVFSRQGHLSALIQVEAPLAMEILEGSLPELRQRFQQSNLSLEQLDLSLAGWDDQSRGRFGAGRFLPEERRWKQVEQPCFIREGPSETALDGYGGGIEYWA